MVKAINQKTEQGRRGGWLLRVLRLPSYRWLVALTTSIV